MSLVNLFFIVYVNLETIFSQPSFVNALKDFVPTILNKLNTYEFYGQKNKIIKAKFKWGYKKVL